MIRRRAGAARRTTAALVAGAIAFGLWTPGLRVAQASVVRPVSFEALVELATEVVVGDPVERTCVWEDGRIVTYTRVEVRDSIAGARGDSVWVRTLGGEVGELGQRVDGEASLEIGKPTLLFLERLPTGTFAVTARAQGQFFIDRRPSGSQLRPHPAMGVFFVKGPHDLVRPAADRLRARPVEDALRDIRARWGASHAKR